MTYERKCCLFQSTLSLSHNSPRCCLLYLREEQDGLFSVGWENTALCKVLHLLGCSASPPSSSDGGTNLSQRDKQAGAVCSTSSLSTLQGWVPLEGSHPYEHLLLFPQDSSPWGRAPEHTQEPWGDIQQHLYFQNHCPSSPGPAPATGGADTGQMASSHGTNPREDTRLILIQL